MKRLPPNKALQRTPLRVDRDHSDFEGWKPLDTCTDLDGGAAERQAVGRRPIVPVPPCDPGCRCVVQYRTMWRDLSRSSEGGLMTTLLEQAFAEAAKLPVQEQEALALWLMEELKADRRWAQLLASSVDVLDQLADEAVAEFRAGRTQVLDPEQL